MKLTQLQICLIIIYQVSKFICSSILLVKRGSREILEIPLLPAKRSAQTIRDLKRRWRQRQRTIVNTITARWNAPS